MPAALITSPVNNVSTHVRHTELCRVGAVILTIFRHKSTEGWEHLLRDTQLVEGGQDLPAPHCSSSPRVRDSLALCHLILSPNQVSSTSLSASGTFLFGRTWLLLSSPRWLCSWSCPLWVCPASQGCLWFLRQPPSRHLQLGAYYVIGAETRASPGCWAALGWLEQDLPWLICHWWGPP